MTINKDEYFMQKALQEAEKAFEAGEIPVGAIITVNDKIIAKAHNLTELLPRCYCSRRNTSHHLS